MVGMRFTLRQAMTATAYLAVSFAAFAAILSWRPGRAELEVAALLIMVCCGSFGACIGTMFKRPLWGALICMFGLPAAWIIGVRVAIDSGWMSFP
jgi:hypothetical protein